MSEWTCSVRAILQGEIRKMAGHLRLGVLQAMGKKTLQRLLQEEDGRQREPTNYSGLAQPQRGCSRECLHAFPTSL